MSVSPQEWVDKSLSAVTIVEAHNYQQIIEFSQQVFMNTNEN